MSARGSLKPGKTRHGERDECAYPIKIYLNPNNLSRAFLALPPWVTFAPAPILGLAAGEPPACDPPPRIQLESLSLPKSLSLGAKSDMRSRSESSPSLCMKGGWFWAGKPRSGMPAANESAERRKYDGSRDPTAKTGLVVEGWVAAAGVPCSRGKSVNPRPWICSVSKVREPSWLAEDGGLGDGDVEALCANAPSSGTRAVLVPRFA